MITHHQIKCTNRHISSSSADKEMIINIVECNADKATSMHIAPAKKVDQTNDNIIEV